jgi:hypothetical protein
MRVTRHVATRLGGAITELVGWPPALQAGVGFALLFLTPGLTEPATDEPPSIGHYAGTMGPFAGLALTVIAIGRGLLHRMGADSFGDATTTQQLIVVAAGLLTVFGAPIAVWHGRRAVYRARRP